MKRTLTGLLALALIVLCFAGCSGGSTTSSATPTPATTQTDTPSGSTPVTEAPPAETPSPYNLAPGKYAVDEEGWPLEGYNYDAPLSTTGEVLSYWTVNYTPQYLPEEGLEGIDFCIEEQRRTGVDIEYLCIPSETRDQNFAVLLASDDLPDMMNQADIYYPGTEIEAIEEGYFANIYDYREYAPNYLYFIRSHMDEDRNLYDQCFLDDTHISKFMGLNNRGGLDATVIAVRADWLDKLGINKDDVVTLDQYEEIGDRMRTEFGATYPLQLLYESLDTGNFLGCFDTYTILSTTYINSFPSPHVEDGKVVFYFSDEHARNFVERAAHWVADGYVTPNWLSGTDGERNVLDGISGFTVMPVSTLDYYNSASTDPDARWEIVKKPSLYEGQVHHLGINRGLCNGYGRTQISAKCANIPLAVSWCDWRYCPEGSELSAWGVEGRLWEYDSEGQRVATDWAYHNPEGQMFAFLQCTYSSNFLAEHGLGDAMAAYSYPGGYKAVEYFDYWYQVDYDGAYEWPLGITLTDEQSSAFTQYADMDTYICENIVAFVDGSKPMSEWDSYIQGLYSMGLEDAQAIYQEAYDAYLARSSARSAA